MCFRVRLSCCVTSSNPKDTMYCKTLLVGQTGCCDRDGYLGDNRHRHALSRCPSPCPEPSADSAGSIHLHEVFAERTLCPSSSTVSLVSTQLHQFFAEHTPYRSRRRSLHRRTCHCPLSSLTKADLCLAVDDSVVEAHPHLYTASSATPFRQGNYQDQCLRFTQQTDSTRCYPTLRTP